MNNSNIFIQSVTKASLYFLVALALMLVSCIHANSQTQKGNWMVGGYFGFNHVNETTSIALNPNGGYLLTDHLALGAGLSLSYNYNKEYNIFSTGIYPYAKYYFGSKKLQPFLSASASSAFSKWNYEGNEWNDPYKYSDWYFSWRAAGGISYFLNDNAAMEGLLGYNFTGNDLYINFGFQIFLGKRKE